MRLAVSVAKGAVAVAVLHAALTMFYWLPDPRAANFLAPTWDLFAFVGIIALWAVTRDGTLAHTRFGQRVASAVRRARERAGRGSVSAPARIRLVGLFDRALRVALTAAAALFLVLGFAQGFARREFGYDLVLPLHIPYMPELFRMMYEHEPLGMFLLYCALLAVGVALAIGVLYASVSALSGGCRRPRWTAGLVVAVALFGLGAGATAGIRPPLAREAIAQFKFALDLEKQLRVTARGMEIESARVRPLNPFARMQDPPSIFNFVIESYGAVVFRDDEMRSWAEKPLAERLAELEDAGYAVRTGYMVAPVFGGSSWMAQQTLMCSVWVNNQERFESLFETRVRCLPELLNEAGYRTVVSAGNTTYLEDRYERKFPFDAYYFRDDFGYEGYRYGWSFIPDQFAIHHVDRNEIRHRGDEPMLVHFQLTSSHHPWSEIPPVIADWDSIGEDGSNMFSEPAKAYSNQFVRGSKYKRGYWETVNYSFKVITDYVSELPDDDALIVILGDHQPRKPVATMNDNTWWVPVHVLSRDHAAVERFAELGYVEGMAPPEVDPAGEEQPDGLDHYIRHIFEAYGSDGDKSRER